MLPTPRHAHADGSVPQYPPLGIALRTAGALSSNGRPGSRAGSLPQSSFSSPLSAGPIPLDGWSAPNSFNAGSNQDFQWDPSEIGDIDLMDIPTPDTPGCGHEEFILRLRTYIGSLETENTYLKSKLDMLLEAHQKLVDKVAVNEPPKYHQKDYPEVMHWRPKSATKDNGSVASMTAKAGKRNDYVEDEHGNPVGDFVMEAIKQCMRGVWHQLNNEGRAPKNWGAAEDYARELLRKALYRDFWFLALCDYHWKVDALATKCYPSWAQTYIAKDASTKVEPRDTPARSLKREHEGDIEPAKKKPKQAPVLAQPIDVDAHCGPPPAQPPAASAGRAPAAPAPTLADLLAKADMAVNGSAPPMFSAPATGTPSTSATAQSTVAGAAVAATVDVPAQEVPPPPTDCAVMPPAHSTPPAPISAPPPPTSAIAGDATQCAAPAGAAAPSAGLLLMPPSASTPGPMGPLSLGASTTQPAQAPAPAPAPSAPTSLLALATVSSQNVQDKAATIAAPRKEEQKVRKPIEGKITGMGLCKTEWMASNPTAFKKDWEKHWGQQNKAHWNRLAAQKKTEASRAGASTS